VQRLCSSSVLSRSFPFPSPAHSLSPSFQPVVSTANVSQLAADRLIATLALERIGIFDPQDLVPVVGGREDGADGITMPLECKLFVSLSAAHSHTLHSIRPG